MKPVSSPCNMKHTSPPREFTPPGYVDAFMLTALLLMILGVGMIVKAIVDGVFPFGGIGLLLGAFVNYLYGEIANDVARSAWQSARLAYELQPVIDEIRLQGEERAYRDREARKQKEAEIQRKIVIEEENDEIYFIDIEGRERGPFSLLQLRDLYAKGSITLDLVTRTENEKPGPNVNELLFPED